MRDPMDACIGHVDALLQAGYAGLRQPSYPTTSLRFLQRLDTAAEKEEDVPQAKVKLKVIIVGAGLGGFAAAIALQRRGHTVTIFEQAPRLEEVGAGIQVPPNSAKLLLRWGMGPLLEGLAMEPREIKFRRWESGDIIGLTRLVPDCKQRYDAPYLVVHRANLQLSMYKRALELGVEVRVNSGVRTYNAEAPSIMLEDGTVHGADLVVGADGLKSEARKVVLDGKDQPPVRAGYAAYRAMVDVDSMATDPDTSWLLEHPGQNLWIGDMRHVMTYTVAGGKSFNMVLSHPDNSDPETWNPATAVRDMKQQFQGWDPRLLKVINMIQTTLRWPLLSGRPLKKWVSASEKLLILGDAAHAMVPYMSSGAAMAVEDGAALAEVLSLITSRAQLSSAIKTWERLRTVRSNQMLEASLVNGKLWHFKDGPEQRARDLAMRPEVEGRPFTESPNQWSDPLTQAWAYGYDAEREMRNVWKEQLADSARL